MSDTLSEAIDLMEWYEASYPAFYGGMREHIRETLDSMHSLLNRLDASPGVTEAEIRAGHGRRPS